MKGGKTEKMAQFQNQATLSYTGGTTASNVATGEILDVLSVSKNAVYNSYSKDGTVTYVIGVVNSGATALNAVTVTDNLGEYAYGAVMLYPLTYIDGTLRYYLNGVLQTTAPTVTAGPPLSIGPFNLPAESNALFVFETRPNAFAPLAAESEITNEATVNGTGITTAPTATETVGVLSAPALSISKTVSPKTVSENGQINYTFIIQNSGNVAATAADNVIITDVFDPILGSLSVALDGTAWTRGTEYTYNEATGEFASTAGAITVPAATYTQNADGSFTVTPGVATLTVTGTIV